MNKNETFCFKYVPFTGANAELRSSQIWFQHGVHFILIPKLLLAHFILQCYLNMNVFKKMRYLRVKRQWSQFSNECPNT